MPTIPLENSITINAPAEAIFPYVGDLMRHIEWCHQPQEMTALTDGPVRVGSQYETLEAPPDNSPAIQKIMFTIAMPIMKMIYGFGDHTIAEITVLEPSTHIAWKAKLPARNRDMMRMNWEIHLQAHDDVTKVTQKGELAPPDNSPFARLANDDLAQQIQSEILTNLQKLKVLVEG
ncbi:MAG: SRPBCC family protein [Chloroflexota bacterium]